MNRPTDTELRVLRDLAIAFREMQTRIEVQYFDQAMRPETYIKPDGHLDVAAYTQAMQEIEAFVESNEATFAFSAPTPTEPFNREQELLFPGIEFECRRRLHSRRVLGEPG